MKQTPEQLRALELAQRIISPEFKYSDREEAATALRELAAIKEARRGKVTPEVVKRFGLALHQAALADGRNSPFAPGVDPFDDYVRTALEAVAPMLAQPAEPVYCVVTDDGTYRHYDEYVPLADCFILWTHPAQPQAVEAEPVAWISNESLRRLTRGGNGSRGSVPVHHERSSVAKNPVYLHPPQPHLTASIATVPQPEPIAPQELADYVADKLSLFRNIDGLLRRDLRVVFDGMKKAYIAEPEPSAKVADVDAMVNRFLSWRIPDSFGPDCYVTFDRDRAKANNMWPVGTNIFTADEAKAMLKHVLTGLVVLPVEPTPAMVNAVCKLKLDRLMRFRDSKEDTNPGIANGVREEYAALLAAAPTQSKVPE